MTEYVLSFCSFVGGVGKGCTVIYLTTSFWFYGWLCDIKTIGQLRQYPVP